MLDRELVCVGLDLKFWPVAKEYLKASIAMNRGALNEEDVYNLIQSKDMQLWGIHDGDLKAVFTTQIVNYQREKRLRLVMIGGHEVDRWEQITSEAMDKFAKENDCSGIELWGRRGWVKRLKKYGYEEYETVVIKHLTP
jgi:hypothetical protein